MSQVELSHVGKSFDELEVIRDVSLSIDSGELVVFVGPSGCGKSTLLRLICGLEHLTRGEISIDGKSMRGVNPARREVAMVFQTYALYPHMTVAENMGFALRMSGVPRSARAERVREAARALRLDDLLDRMPKQLSGGQRQRVAIGRAIVRKPKVFLFDEPLSNLDAELRVQMRLEILTLHRRLRATMVYVTHDQIEAMTMADRIVVLRSGQIEQIGAPQELYEEPANLFVAGFIGSPKMNLLAGKVSHKSGNRVEVVLDGLPRYPLSLTRIDSTLSIGDAVTLGIRPDEFSAPDQGDIQLTAEVEFVENLGGTVLIHAPSHAVGPVVIEAKKGEVQHGQTVTVGLEARCTHLFDSNGMAISRH